MDYARGGGTGDHREERQAMVSSSMGPINSLIHKLHAAPEFGDLRCVLEGIQQHLLLYCDQGVMRGMMVCQWMKQLRELVYNVEDWIDQLLIHYEGRSLPLSLYDSNQLQDLMDQIADAQERGKQFGLLGHDFADFVPSEVTLYPEENNHEKLLAEAYKSLCRSKPYLVGLCGPESEIVQHLIDDEPQVKVVSILGQGGIGKTTLAREIFRKQRSQFDCGALICVGRNPSVNAILMDIAHQVMPKNLLPFDAKLITTTLWEFLGTKRYLVIVDDVWSEWAWSTITCALPENDLGSRILTTTQIENVANFCCVKPFDFVYILKALNDRDSKNLLLRWMSVLKKDYLLDSEIFRIFLKICGGSPLAVVLAAGFLASESARLYQFTMFQSTRWPMVNQDSVSQGIQMILDLSYAHLPLHVKSCFLYFSAFPENHIIRKDRLLRRWIAEGFIPTREGDSSWFTGESYFKELARRGLIQVEFDDNYDQICCTLHSVIHEYIMSLSTQENFVTLGEQLTPGSYPCDKVRRLPLDCSKQGESGILASSTTHLSRVRSFVVTGDTKKQMPNLSVFSLVRVLDLEGAIGMRRHQLRSIRNLLLLRYLGLRRCDVIELPQQMKVLEHLAVIDLRQTKVTHLPELATKNLVSVLADRVMISRRMDDMPELEEIATILISHSSSIHSASNLIAKSKRMRVLGVRFECFTSWDELELLTDFSHAIYRSNLRTLLVEDCSGLFINSLLNFPFTDSWIKRQKFELNLSHISLPKIPAKMAYLRDLTHLYITVCEVEAEGLYVLEGLPRLLVLYLDSHKTLERHIISTMNHYGNSCFQCLLVLSLSFLDGRMGLQFGQGVMPQLRKLNLVFSAENTERQYGDFDFGIQNLSCLEQISITIKCNAHAYGNAAEVAIRDQVSQISDSPPFLEMKIRDQAEGPTWNP